MILFLALSWLFQAKSSLSFKISKSTRLLSNTSSPYFPLDKLEDTRHRNSNNNNLTPPVPVDLNNSSRHKKSGFNNYLIIHSNKQVETSHLDRYKNSFFIWLLLAKSELNGMFGLGADILQIPCCHLSSYSCYVFRK